VKAKPTTSPPPAADEPETVDPAALQAFVDDLYGDSKPTGVVDALIQERRREVPPSPEDHARARPGP